MYMESKPQPSASGQGRVEGSSESMDAGRGDPFILAVRLAPATYVLTTRDMLVPNWETSQPIPVLLHIVSLDVPTAYVLALDNPEG